MMMMMMMMMMVMIIVVVEMVSKVRCLGYLTGLFDWARLDFTGIFGCDVIL